MSNDIKKITLAVPHGWLNTLRKQAFRFQMKFDDFLSMGLVEFVRNLPDAYLDHMEAVLPDPIEKSDELFESITWAIHPEWAVMLESDARALEVTPLTLLYVSLLWLANLPEDDEHLRRAKDSSAWLTAIQG